MHRPGMAFTSVAGTRLSLLVPNVKSRVATPFGKNGKAPAVLRSGALSIVYLGFDCGAGFVPFGS
ncbi:hypothetical protein BMW22_24220 [Rhizobium leguminosarum]|uniref:Uncharacterized protein n=2 Tax=Rhizobium leguminosarum TaxID=384 RepID=A0A1L3ZF69_RHILE|nr:hypothetical protein BMW22_24220 [Rhizobium leguminosarum]